MSKQQIVVRDLGKMDYQQAWDFQEQLLKENVAKKATAVDIFPKPTTNYLLFVEHPPVYTIGKSGHMENLLLSKDQLEEEGIGFFNTNRGGDITFHGPGQIVGYPIIDLENFFTDIGKYLRFLEETIIRTIGDYGVTGDRSPGETGVWLDPQDKAKARKICAMGVRCSRWVTMHGFALNVNTPLSYFGNIVPCGIADKQVAALNQEVGHDVDIAEVKAKLIKHFSDVFDAEMI
ncbi:lipoyl(octanoyl) transferase LipB [Chitinophaga sp. Cy-1792]|uniref:lipoyl(octanoyl) transferase LipB n=1 Tax=Chitinophaga sp. Cy-1792 TaxID=2608339 RepID=UPI00141D8108|nr:lipoyl(octanoyl) transferase LipB [Chitinophaga sp. Cy-1792]NIG57251.1 lipoyl(octanoyl) transferase LipB [Chitinophaga sp. Cy-1792]